MRESRNTDRHCVFRIKLFTCFFYLQFEPSGWITYSFLENKTRNTEHMEKKTDKRKWRDLSYIPHTDSSDETVDGKQEINKVRGNTCLTFLPSSQSPTDTYNHMKSRKKKNLLFSVSV